jgi:hypothetical protein
LQLEVFHLRVDLVETVGLLELVVLEEQQLLVVLVVQVVLVAPAAFLMQVG